MSAVCEPLSSSLSKRIRSVLSSKSIVLVGGSLIYDNIRGERIIHLSIESLKGGAKVDLANVQELKEIPEIVNVADCLYVNGSVL